MPKKIPDESFDVICKNYMGTEPFEAAIFKANEIGLTGRKIERVAVSAKFAEGIHVRCEFKQPLGAAQEKIDPLPEHSFDFK